MTCFAEIYNDQYQRFEGEVADSRVEFASPAEAARHLKDKALEFGADIVGICEIEPSDVYRGRVVTEKYAIAVGQRMRWREFQVVPSRESAIECLRVYFTLGETVIQLAAYHAIDRLRLQGRASDRRQRPAAHPDRAEGRLRRARPARLDHPSHARPALPHGQRRDIDSSWRSTIRSTPASRSSATPAARAGSSVRRTRFRTSAAPEAGKDHLGYDRYVVDTGRCFPYFAKHSYCSICLPVCVYNHKEWARDFDGFHTKLFPTVLMPDAPAPVDLPQDQPRHFYARIHRP